MKKLTILLILLALYITTPAATLYVPSKYPTIQSAIDAAIIGDTVIVAPGTYVENINFNGKDIVLTSTDPDHPEDTIIDGGSLDSVVTFSGTESSSCELKGFTIQNGSSYDGGGIYGGNDLNSTHATISNCIIIGNIAVYESGGGGLYAFGGSITNCTITGNSAGSGGGMFNLSYSSPTVTNCTFTDNSAGKGGGMRNASSNPTVINCTFSNNTANDFSGFYGYGGGICNSSSDPTIINCTFSNNSSVSGGGIWNSKSSPTITNCKFNGNVAESSFYCGGSGRCLGGGICNERDSNPVVTDCTFNNNYAGAGGGIYNGSSDPTVDKCRFIENTAFGPGGGMGNVDARPIVSNCIFNSNSAKSGGGIFNRWKSHSLVINCTFSGNWTDYDRGGGMFNDWSDPMVTNCILWSNGMIQFYNYDDSNPVITYSDIQGGWEGEGNIDADPLFTDPNNGDFHLSPGSLCIDAGDNSVVTELTDLDGNPRIIDGDNDGLAIVDMGTYEFIPSIQASMNFTPQTLNCSSNGNWVKAHFLLPAEFLIEDVDTAKPATIDSLTIISDRMNVSYNNEGLVEIEVAFSRSDFCSTGLFGNIQLTVRGFLTDGTGFHGTDTIRITTNQWEKLPEFSSFWLQTDCLEPDFCEGFDLDQNGTVNLADFVLLAEN